MGVDTKAFLVTGPNHVEIAEAISASIGPVSNVRAALPGDDKFFLINFTTADEGQSRTMYVFLEHEETPDDEEHRVFPYNGKGTYVSLGCWGSSVSIMETLCERFSGYVLDSDTGAVEPRFVDAKTADGVVPPVLSPEAEASVAFSKVLSGAQATLMREIVAVPDHVDAVLEILTRLKAAKATSAG